MRLRNDPSNRNASPQYSWIVHQLNGFQTVYSYRNTPSADILGAAEWTNIKTRRPSKHSIDMKTEYPVVPLSSLMNCPGRLTDLPVACVPPPPPAIPPSNHPEIRYNYTSLISQRMMGDATRRLHSAGTKTTTKKTYRVSTER